MIYFLLSFDLSSFYATMCLHIPQETQNGDYKWRYQTNN